MLILMLMFILMLLSKILFSMVLFMLILMLMLMITLIFMFLLMQSKIIVLLQTKNFSNLTTPYLFHISEKLYEHSSYKVKFLLSKADTVGSESERQKVRKS